MAESPYRQPSSSHSSGTFPDLFAASSLDNRDSSVRQIDESVDKRSSEPQVTSDNRGTDSSQGLGTTRREGTLTEILARVVSSATPVGTGGDAEQHTDGNSGTVVEKESKSQSQCKTESGVRPSFVERTLSGEKDINNVTTIKGRGNKSKKENENIGSEICVFAENRDQEDGTVKNEASTMNQTEVTNSTAVFDSSSCESQGSSNDVSLTMEPIDVTGLKVVEYLSSQCQGQQCGEAKDELRPDVSITGSLCNDSNCTTSKSSGIDDMNICSVVLEDLIRKVVEELDKENFDRNSESSEGVVGFAACCKACANSQKWCYCSGGRAEPCESQEIPCHVQGNKSFTDGDHRSVEHNLGKEKVDFPRDIQETDPPQSGLSNGDETDFNTSPNFADFVKSDTNPNGVRNDLIVTHLVSNELFCNGNSRSAEHELGKETVDVPGHIYTTDQLKPDCGNGEKAVFIKPPRTAGFAENYQSIDTNPDKDNSLRTELIKTPIVCDSFSIGNLNVGSEKFLEKSFVCVDTSCTDAKFSEREVNVSTPPSNTNGSTGAVNATASFFSREFDSEIFVANGREGTPSSGGIEVPVDQALEEVEEEEEEEEEQESWEWFEPPLGDFHKSSLADMEGEGELLFEEEGGGEEVNQVSTCFSLS